MSRKRKVAMGIVSCAILVGSALWVLADPEPRGGGEFGRTWDRDNTAEFPANVCAAQPTIDDPVPAWLLTVVTLSDWGGAGRVVFEVRNWAPEPIEHLIADGFEGNGVLGFHVDSVSPIDVPMSVPMRVEYPLSGELGVGPMILTGQGFHSGECSAFMTKMGCWCNHSRHPVVANLAGLRIEVVYANGLRGKAMIQACPDSGWVWVHGTFRPERFGCAPGTGIAVLATPEV